MTATPEQNTWPEQWPEGRGGGARAALVALLAVLLFELWVHADRQRLQWSLYNMAEIKHERLVDKSREDVALVFGDSRCFHIDPAGVAKALGLSTTLATNYAWPWSGVEVFEAQLRTALRNKPSLKYVVVPQLPLLVGYSDNWTTVRASRNLQLGFQLTTSFSDGLKTLLDQKFWGAAWQEICNTLSPPSLTNQKGLRAEIKGLLLGHGLAKPDPEFLRMRDAYEQQGWFSFAPNSHAVATDAPLLEKSVGGFAVRDNPLVRSSFERFLSLADRSGIEVMMVPLPTAAVNYDKLEKAGIHAEWQRQTRAWEAQYPHVHALGTPEVAFDLPLMGDMVHVNLAGAQRHMELVTELLAAQSGGTR